MSSTESVRRCLAKYRAGRVIGLGQEHPISFQMDADYCAVATEDLKKFGSEWEIRKATPTLWRQIPEKSGVYMFLFESTLTLHTANEVYFRPRVVLYVGRAGDDRSRKTLRDRYRYEYAKYIEGDVEALWSANQASTRSERLARYLTIYPLQYWYCIIEDHSKIAETEDALIKLLNPPLNVAGRPRLKISQPIPAFRSPQ